MRFGIGMNTDPTMMEVGQRFCASYLNSWELLRRLYLSKTFIQLPRAFEAAALSLFRLTSCSLCPWIRKSLVSQEGSGRS